MKHTLHYGRFSFDVVDGEVQHNESQRKGATAMECLKDYNYAYDMAVIANELEDYAEVKKVVA
jgi:hypothetical protein